MAVCEKCWNDAYFLQNGHKDQTYFYLKLLKERKDNPCTPEQQKGLEEKKE